LSRKRGNALRTLRPGLVEADFHAGLPRWLRAFERLNSSRHKKKDYSFIAGREKSRVNFSPRFSVRVARSRKVCFVSGGALGYSEGRRGTRSPAILRAEWPQKSCLHRLYVSGSLGPRRTLNSRERKWGERIGPRGAGAAKWLYGGRRRQIFRTFGGSDRLPLKRQDSYSIPFQGPAFIARGVVQETKNCNGTPKKPAIIYPRGNRINGKAAGRLW